MQMRDGGIVRLYALENIAQPGFMPTEKLVEKGSAYYSKMISGVTRRYAALGANREYDFLIRCWNMTELPDGVKYAIPEDGKQYRIDPAEPIFDEDAIDLTLVRLEDFFDVAADQT